MRRGLQPFWRPLFFSLWKLAPPLQSVKTDVKLTTVFVQRKPETTATARACVFDSLYSETTVIFSSINIHLSAGLSNIPVRLVSGEDLCTWNVPNMIHRAHISMNRTWIIKRRIIKLNNKHRVKIIQNNDPIIYDVYKTRQKIQLTKIFKVTDTFPPVVQPWLLLS